MKLPKSRLGFLFAGVYVFVVALFFIYAKFALCSLDSLCGAVGFILALPWFFILPLNLQILSYFISIFINIILAYFIGAFIQRKSKENTIKIISYAVIVIALLAVIIVGYKFYYKPDFIKFSRSANRNYCQQDSDCVLVSKYQGCCNDCNVEAVNVETKNRDEEARNKQCGTKDYSCPAYKCPSSVAKQAVCEQNRCVVKEKQPANVNTDDNITISFDKTYYQKDEQVNITIQNNGNNEIVIPDSIAIEKYSVNLSMFRPVWEVIDSDIEFPCGTLREKQNIIIPVGSGKTFFWDSYTDKIDTELSGALMACVKADLGKYKVKIDYLGLPHFSNLSYYTNHKHLS